MYVYARTGGGWTLQQQLTANGGDPNDRFGFSVSLRGDVIVAGAPYDTAGGNNNQGSAYVFRRTVSHVGTGRADHRLRRRHRRPVRVGGGPVRDDGGRRRPLRGTAGQRELRRGARLLRPTSTGGDRAWTETARLTASNAARADNFGFSVALAGDTLLAGAPHRDGRANDEGPVYAYARSGSDLDRGRAADEATRPDHSERFGTAVALDGTDASWARPAMTAPSATRAPRSRSRSRRRVGARADATSPADDEPTTPGSAPPSRSTPACSPSARRQSRDHRVATQGWCTRSGRPGAWTDHQVLRVPDAAAARRSAPRSRCPAASSSPALPTTTSNH